MWDNPISVELALLHFRERTHRLREEARLERELRQRRSGGTRRARVLAYVFIRAERPSEVVEQVRRIRGVLKADTLQGSGEAIAVVEGRNLEGLEALVSRIKSLPGIVAAKSKLAA
jgi:nitrate reductase NapAB chaperone NapD